MIGVDTNISVYAADSRGDPVKHKMALAFVDEVSRLERGVLSTQALAEFYAAVCRKNRLTPEAARAYIEAWNDLFSIRSPAASDVTHAARIHQTHGISFWDAMMWAVLRRAGVEYLVSEDMQDGRELEGVRIVNPFALQNARLIDRILGRFPI